MPQARASRETATHLRVSGVIDGPLMLNGAMRLLAGMTTAQVKQGRLGRPTPAKRRKEKVLLTVGRLARSLNMEIQFPIEFLVPGTPVSSQGKLAKAKNEWKARVKVASTAVLPAPYFASQYRLSATLFYFPDEPMQGDIDNIVKLVLDAMSRHIYIDDAQVERIVVQKFEPGNVFAFAEPSAKLEEALNEQKPVLYVRLSADPFEDLK